jgi:hypothetical protein
VQFREIQNRAYNIFWLSGYIAFTIFLDIVYIYGSVRLNLSAMVSHDKSAKSFFLAWCVTVQD